MSLQSPAPVPLGLSDGPPVSPPAREGAELRDASVSEAPTPLRHPPEADLVQAGRLTMGQLSQAHRDRLETGKQVLDIIVERGWVSAEEVAELRAKHGIPAPVPAPVQAAPDPAPAPPESEPPPAASARFTIGIRLNTGDLIPVGETDDGDKAIALGHAVVTDLTEDDAAWPFFGGRYINPETIVSVDLLPGDPDA
jgi:hypothetical protein